MDARSGVRHLQRLLVSYCKHSGSSRGARVFIEENITKLKQEYPHLDIEVQVLFSGKRICSICGDEFFPYAGSKRAASIPRG